MRSLTLDVGSTITKAIASRKKSKPVSTIHDASTLDHESDDLLKHQRRYRVGKCRKRCGFGIPDQELATDIIQHEIATHLRNSFCMSRYASLRSRVSCVSGAVTASSGAPFSREFKRAGHLQCMYSAGGRTISDCWPSHWLWNTDPAKRSALFQNLRHSHVCSLPAPPLSLRPFAHSQCQRPWPGLMHQPPERHSAP